MGNQENVIVVTENDFLVEVFRVDIQKMDENCNYMWRIQK